MSTAEYTITLHNTENSAPKSTEVQDKPRIDFYTYWIKFTAIVITGFAFLLMVIFSAFSIERIEYLPSAVILMVTLWIISELLEKDGEQNG